MAYGLSPHKTVAATGGAGSLPVLGMHYGTTVLMVASLLFAALALFAMLPKMRRKGSQK